REWPRIPSFSVAETLCSRAKVQAKANPRRRRRQLPPPHPVAQIFVVPPPEYVPCRAKTCRNVKRSSSQSTLSVVVWCWMLVHDATACPASGFFTSAHRRKRGDAIGSPHDRDGVGVPPGDASGLVLNFRTLGQIAGGHRARYWSCIHCRREPPWTR